MITQMIDDETINVTDDEIAAFVSGAENEPAEETVARARRVLTAALSDFAVRERLLWLRSAQADWEAEEKRLQTAQKSVSPDETARLLVLQNRLRDATRRSVGLGELVETRGKTPQTDAVMETPSRHDLWSVWKTGGGRWAAGAAQSARDVMQAVQEAGRNARQLVLGGQRTALSLPCLAPALAAPAPQTASEPFSDAITTADGVRITFQQSPGSQSRMRVLVDASHLAPEGGADGEDRPPYNVAFLTLMEGEETENNSESHSRHLLVVALNARGTGYSDFSVSPGDALSSDASAQKTFPAPRAGGCRLVAATLSQMPPPELDITS